MGIRFACHHCNHALHVKDFQAGKRGRCPECKEAFRIPMKDASYSLVLDETDQNSSGVLTQVTSTMFGGSTESSSSISIETEAKPTNREGNLPRPTQAAPKAKIESPFVQSVDSLEMPALLRNALDAKWFVRPPSGGQFGPASSHLLMDWIVERRVTLDSFLWREGMPQWQSANELIPELFKAEPPLIPPVPINGEPSIEKSLSSLTTSGPVPSGLVKKKKEQKRRQQLTVVILLGVVSLILLIALVFVLVFQNAKG